jgi:iron complex transport system ATP-binding protein
VAEIMLEAVDCTVEYNGHRALNDVSLSLREGEIIALLGANGAGKTTLIRALNGTVPLTAGSIKLDKKKLDDLSRREIAASISVVAQENETRFPISVTDFVLSGRFVHGGSFGWETKTDLRAAEQAIDDCDLAGLAARLMNNLSGGERQRVVLARALATGAKTLLLDEPTANLDLAHQALMFRLVRERCRTADSSAVVITHDLNLASAFADQVVMLKDGQVAAKGTPVEVLTAENIRDVFGVDVLLDQNPASRKVRVTALY